jgi:hypothetical protein
MMCWPSGSRCECTSRPLHSSQSHINRCADASNTVVSAAGPGRHVSSAPLATQVLLPVCCMLAEVECVPCWYAVRGPVQV